MPASNAHECEDLEAHQRDLLRELVDGGAAGCDHEMPYSPSRGLGQPMVNDLLSCLARRRCDVILAMLRTGEHYPSADQLAARTSAGAA